MIINKTPGFILLVAVIAQVTCDITVTPPEGYPPAEDYIAPAEPVNTRAELVMQELYLKRKPAILVTWDAGGSSDVLFYKIYKRSGGEFRQEAARLKVTPYYYDTNISFPEAAGSSNNYYYKVTAIDSSGNESVFSDPDTITLVIAPVLFYPEGEITAADLEAFHFHWRVNYNVGKNFTVFVSNEEHDTLIQTGISPAGYDDVVFRRLYNALAAASEAPAPAVLPAGNYYWWVQMDLTEGDPGQPERVSLAYKTFRVDSW